MSDEADVDPDADVPLWINILVPIVTGLLFFSTLVILFHTKKEIPVEKLEEWVEKFPLVNKWFSTGGTDNDVESTTTTKTGNISKIGPKTNEQSKIRKSSSWHDVRRYDSISSIKTHNNTVSDMGSQSPGQNPYFHASQGTLVSFESSV